MQILLLGAKRLAIRQGAIITHLHAIERLASLSLLYVDKIGTLTRNEYVLQQEETVIYHFLPRGEDCDDNGEEEASTTLPQLLLFAIMAMDWQKKDKKLMIMEEYQTDYKEGSEAEEDVFERVLWNAFHEINMNNVLDDLEEVNYQLIPLLSSVTARYRRRSEGMIHDHKTNLLYSITKGHPKDVIQFLVLQQQIGQRYDDVLLSLLLNPQPLLQPLKYHLTFHLLLQPLHPLLPFAL